MKLYFNDSGFNNMGPIFVLHHKAGLQSCEYHYRWDYWIQIFIDYKIKRNTHQDLINYFTNLLSKVNKFPPKQILDWLSKPQNL